MNFTFNFFCSLIASFIYLMYPKIEFNNIIHHCNGNDVILFCVFVFQYLIFFINEGGQYGQSTSESLKHIKNFDFKFHTIKNEIRQKQQTQAIISKRYHEFNQN